MRLSTLFLMSKMKKWLPSGPWVKNKKRGKRNQRIFLSFSGLPGFELSGIGEMLFGVLSRKM